MRRRLVIRNMISNGLDEQEVVVHLAQRNSSEVRNEAVNEGTMR